MKYKSFLEFVEKEKDVTKLFRIKERPDINFCICIMCFVKSFEKLFCMSLIMSLNSMKSLEPL